MQVSVETTQGLGRRMTVTVPKERIEGEVEKRLKSLAGKAKVKGFRPGKAPFNIVRQQYASQVLHEVTGDVMQSTFVEAIKQQKLRPAGTPEIHPAVGQAGNLEYTATFEVYPEITLKGLDTITVERAVVTITEADVDKIIENLRSQRKVWIAVDRVAKMGDKVLVDFVGTIDGAEFPGGTGKDVDVELGKKRMIPGLEEQLVGTKAGMEVNIAVNFPDTYPAKELAGKPAQFLTQVKEVQEASLPPVDEEFAKVFGVEQGGVEALRKQVRDNLEREADTTIKTRVKTQIFDGLIGLKLLDVPRALLDTEITSLRQQHQDYMKRYGGRVRAEEMSEEEYEFQGRRRVELGLLLSEIIQKNNLKVTPARLREEVEKLAASYDDPAMIVKHIYGSKEQLSEVESNTLEQTAIEWILGQAKVVDKPMAFDSLVNPAKTAA